MMCMCIARMCVYMRVCVYAHVGVDVVCAYMVCVCVVHMRYTGDVWLCAFLGGYVCIRDVCMYACVVRCMLCMYANMMCVIGACVRVCCVCVC